MKNVSIERVINWAFKAGFWDKLGIAFIDLIWNQITVVWCALGINQFSFFAWLKFRYYWLAHTLRYFINRLIWHLLFSQFIYYYLLNLLKFWTFFHQLFPHFLLINVFSSRVIILPIDFPFKLKIFLVLLKVFI